VGNPVAPIVARPSANRRSIDDTVRWL
jgi:hypothetical protein